MLWDDTGETRNGVPIWKARCGNKRCRLSAVKEPTCACWCAPKPAGGTCKHLGEKLGSIPCGCGAVEKKLPVYVCNILGPCTERSSGKPQRFHGAKISVCLGCSKREAYREAT